MDSLMKPSAARLSRGQKVAVSLKTIVFTLLIVAIAGLYLFLRAEKVSNIKTLQLKDEQIKLLQDQAAQAVNLK